MNLMRFLTRVDQIISRLSQKELTAFIHEIARTLPEEKRDIFLGKLRDTSPENDESDRLSSVEIQSIEEIREKIRQAKQDLQRINCGELCFYGSLNEEYDDWYDSMDEEFIIEDPDNITGRLGDEFHLVHQRIDTELYEEGYTLFGQITGLTITIGGEYGEYQDSELDFYEAVQDLSLDIRLENFVPDGLYAAY